MTEKKEQPHQVHDRGYKSLLSHWKILKHLLEGYVSGEEWILDLDFEKATQLDTSKISRNFDERRSDVLYTIPINKGKEEIFLYLLVEHQSTIDQTMAFRVLDYSMDIWRHFHKNSDEKERKQKGFKFPPVFPIVLYNGKTSWSALPSMKELVNRSEIFGEHIPDVKYYLIDIPRLSKDKVKKIGNALSTVFLLEQNIKFKDVDEVKATISEALSFLDNEADKEVRNIAIDWVIMHMKVEYPEYKEKLEKIDFSKHSYQEIKTMIETLPEKLVAYGEEKGRQEIAIKMLKKGKEISEIAEWTDLTKQEVQKLKEKHKL